jgi:hypothetical protein
MNVRNRKHPERKSEKYEVQKRQAKDVCRDRVKWRSILSAYPAKDMV